MRRLSGFYKKLNCEFYSFCRACFFCLVAVPLLHITQCTFAAGPAFALATRTERLVVHSAHIISYIVPQGFATATTPKHNFHCRKCAHHLRLAGTAKCSPGPATNISLAGVRKRVACDRRCFFGHHWRRRLRRHVNAKWM